jgi:ribosomal protein L37AE/L43A
MRTAQEHEVVSVPKLCRVCDNECKQDKDGVWCCMTCGWDGSRYRVPNIGTQHRS